MNDSIDDPYAIRSADTGLVARALDAARARTLDVFAATRAALGSKLELRYAAEVNPPLWELGHVGWFEEFWIGRNCERLRGQAARLEAPRAAPLLAGADALYDSSRVAHARRWHLDLPDAARTLAQLAQIRERTQRLLRNSAPDDDALYFFRLVLMHEAMHAEAAAMIAQTLAFDVRAALPAASPAASAHAGELFLPAARVVVGAHEGGFAFDNELGAHAIELPPFTIGRAPVTWGAYLPFIEAGGYDNAKAWTRDGWAWRLAALPNGLPRHLSRSEGGALRRASFGRWDDLDPREPAIHLSQYEAHAWCNWAGRRLPSEHEWAQAALSAVEDFSSGEVWEWTSSSFAPWTGFTPHPYRDYSQPWFDGRPVLKGGSFATAAFMKHPRYRNFFEAGRNDVFAGFRSCAL